MDVFVVGAQRSGTTWVQAMLGAHPAVAAPQEVGLFHRVLGPWADGFEREVATAAAGGRERRVIGLACVLTRAELDRVQRRVLDDVSDAARRLKPGASVLVEKTPDNALHIDLIRRLRPEARFIHVIRDGRDVASSLLAARTSWGGVWAPRDVQQAAERWRQYVAGAMRARAAGDGYIEVRYEDLLDERKGPNELARLFAHCGVDVPYADVESIHARFAFDRVAAAPDATYDSVLVGGEAARVAVDGTREPDGFFRAGRAGTWTSWARHTQWRFEDTAGDLLVSLGYEDDRSWCGDRSSLARRTALGAHRGVGAVRRAAGHLLRRAVLA